MGGWCSYKIAQLLCRPGPPAWSGRRRAFLQLSGPAAPEGYPGLSARAPRGRSARRPAPSLPRASPSDQAGRTEAAALGAWAAGAQLVQLAGHRSPEKPVGADSPCLGRAPRGCPGNPRAQVEAPSGGCELAWERECPNKQVFVGRDASARGVRAWTTLRLHTGFQSCPGGPRGSSLHIIFQTSLKY